MAGGFGRRIWSEDSVGGSGRRIRSEGLAGGFGRTIRSEDLVGGFDPTSIDTSTLNKNSPLGGNGGISSRLKLARQGLGTRMLSAGAYAGARAKIGIKNGAKALGKKGVRFTRRAVVGGLAGGTAALLAAGVGATSPEKAASLIAAAGAAGYSFGNYYGDKLAKGVSSYADGSKTAFWGKDMKAIKQANFDKEFMNDPETLSNLTMALGSTSAARDAIKDGRLQAVLNNNITDKAKAAKTLALAEKIKSRHSGMSDDQALAYAIGAAKLNRDANPGIFNPGSREEANFKNYAARQYAASGLSGKNLTDAVDQLLEDLQYFEI